MAEIFALARCDKNVVNFLWNFFFFGQVDSRCDVPSFFFLNNR